MSTSAQDLGALNNEEISQSKIWQVIGASAVGTMIEWYDFYIFGSLAGIISPLFYPPDNNTFAYIAYLATFAVGFVVRPFGALFFGRIGDLVGRKYAFLVTLLIMGGATAVIGFLPTFAQIGWAAPVILLLIRVLQGLALGGEYGGAAVYVAEHVPDNRRGFYTSFIQITATLGLFVSLAVILSVQNLMSADQFAGKNGRFRGLAHSVFDFDFPRRHLALHSPSDEGITDFPTRQISRYDLRQPFGRSLYALG
jgi:MFS family permease